MEDVIGVVFDTVFHDIERDGLMARYKRRELAAYLSDVVVSSGQEQEGCAFVVRAVLRVHADSKANNGTVCLFGKFHHILYVAAKLSFDWRLEDREILTSLFNQMYSCEHSFERIVISAILGPRVTRLLSGWQADFTDEKESLHALDYFLDHAICSRLAYYVDDNLGRLRMVDVPMPSYHDAPPAYVACVMDRPAALLLLLRYGGRISPKPHCEWEEESAPSALLQQLQRMGEILQRGSLVPKAATDCLRLLMRVVPHVAISDEQQREYAEVLLPPARWHDPPELKHLSRCAVRRELWKAWQLPGGIHKLPIPLTLKPYLDLMED